MTTNFRTQIDYNSALVKNCCARFSPTLLLPLSSRPYCYGNQPFSRQLAPGSEERQTLKRSCYAIYSVAMG